MSKTKNIVKSVAKKTDLTAAKTGSDPRDPWSASGAGGGIAIPENVTSRRSELLAKYYKSKGWNVNYISKNKKVSQSKKGDYEKWKQDHGIYEEDEVNEDLTTKITHPEIRSEITHSPTLKRKRQLDQAAAQYAIPAPAGTMKRVRMKKEETNLDEISLGDYKEKAKAQVKELKPHAKGEYGDIVKRAVKRRESGLAMAAKREEVELDEISFAPYSRRGAPKTPAELEKIRKALAREKKNTVPGQLKQNEPNYKKDNYKKDTTLKYFSKIGEEDIDEAKTSSAVKLQQALKKEKAKSTASVLRAKAWMDQMKQDSQNKKEVKEDNFGDPKAASEVPFDMGNTPNQVAPKKMSKVGSMVKEIYARRRLGEDMYDWEKDQKDAKPLGKKPSMQKADGTNELGDKKPNARIVLKGGTTLTGEKRDMVEIDPMLKNRTSIPDYKDMDKKKQKSQEQ